ncbi:hypothetical protein [Siccirubricoccus sp. G192]|uniref:hypothetical protein n=1 Tax=Siccirubricoccus sp. G192 TaxID=2849651 RepID=UPI0020C20E73|nr:hypothetical protein [Siccirubricoccus sp. G192]
MAADNAISRALDSDLWWSFKRSPITVASAIVALVCIGAAVLAPWIAPHNPFDLASLNLLDAFKPPAWNPEGDAAYPFGTDDQGRDMLSAIMYGARVSLLVGFSATIFATLTGVAVGLLAGYAGGRGGCGADAHRGYPAHLSLHPRGPAGGWRGACRPAAGGA